MRVGVKVYLAVAGEPALNAGAELGARGALHPIRDDVADAMLDIFIREEKVRQPVHPTNDRATAITVSSTPIKMARC
jgi:hypothetical protein